MRWPTLARAALDGDSAGSAEELMLAESQLVRLNTERRLAFLGTLGNNAPFAGLLGTVIGIVRAFQTLDAGTGAPRAGLMGELGHALIATAVGLIVALPAVAAFNTFQRIAPTLSGWIVRVALVDGMPQLEKLVSHHGSRASAMEIGKCAARMSS